jgi:RNA polymerase sigma-70 factor (ECF subfamily)
MENTVAKQTRHQFEQNVLSHLEEIYTAATYLGRTRAEAAGLAQKTMVEAYRHFGQLPDDTDYKKWIFTILTSIEESEARIRTAHRYPSHGTDEKFTYHPVEALRYIDVTGQEFFSDISQEDLRDTVRNLPDDLRLMVALFFAGEFTYADLADITGLPIETVRTRLHFGRQQLREKILDLCPA